MKEKVIQLCSHKDRLLVLTDQGNILEEKDVWLLKGKEVEADLDNIKKGARRFKKFVQVED